ncbi:MAG: hypothetical protein CSB44_11460 [Gammaproteobacteria bacterium]|nr:MAG: hypothetical protein CSB44_11460 [Gammaproteobacteria bacterium]
MNRHLSTFLTLGRVSNLPTVWTNVLAGAVIAGGPGDVASTALLMFAMSLAYIGGMFLNDAADAAIDARERAERPIPLGLVRCRDVTIAGIAMLALSIAIVVFGFHHRPAAGIAAVLLALAIVLYDLWHKGNRFAPLLMGACRMLVYVVAGFALGDLCGSAGASAGASADASADASAGALAGALAGTLAGNVQPLLYVAALALLLYLVGLTAIAAQETRTTLRSLRPLALLLAPLPISAIMVVHQLASGHPGNGSAWLAAALLLSLWLAHVLTLLDAGRRGRGRPGHIPTAVGAMLAGISLVDALLIAAFAGWPPMLLAVAGGLLTLAAQRVIVPT